MTRGRVEREEATPVRRRRADEMDGFVRKLRTNALMDREQYFYFWEIDTGTRIYDKTVLDDYDFVSNDGKTIKRDSDGLGDAVMVTVGIGGGQTAPCYLLRKPIGFYRDDQKKTQDRIDSFEEALRRTPETASQVDNAYGQGLRTQAG